MANDNANLPPQGADRWARVAVAAPEREDRLPLEPTVAKWQKIYEAFGATGENARDEVFVAVNAYFAVNGCSPEGKYSREVVTGGGTRRSVDVVVKITGRLEGDIRQFLRGKMKDSYECLKNSAVLKSDEGVLARAEAQGIPRHLVHLVADWFKGCEFLTAEEQDVYDRVSARNIAEARGRRAQAKGEAGRRADLAESPVVEPGAAPVQFASY